jgi:hypothetical protein
MVFTEIFYYHCCLLCGASCIAIDLVAAANNAGMEDRAYRWNTCPFLVFFPDDNGIHSYSQGVFQTD